MNVQRDWGLLRWRARLSLHHSARLKIADPPDWDWYDISAHVESTECGAIGWVGTWRDTAAGMGSNIL